MYLISCCPTPKSDLEFMNINDMMCISLDEVSMSEAKSSQQEMLFALNVHLRDYCQDSHRWLYVKGIIQIGRVSG